VYKLLHFQEEVVHLGKFLSKNEPGLNIHMEYKDSNLPPLGARVRRGPDWVWDGQDEGGPGTVVGHDGKDWYTMSLTGLLK
jgi:hypothetical protein